MLRSRCRRRLALVGVEDLGDYEAGCRRAAGLQHRQPVEQLVEVAARAVRDGREAQQEPALAVVARDLGGEHEGRLAGAAVERDAQRLAHAEGGIRRDPHAARRQKTFEIDEKVFKRLPLAQRQPTILFEPNDLQLVESEPSLRRNYFDNIIEQYTPGYEKNRSQYKRVVAQRNALLKQGGNIDSQIFAWNLRLVDLGEKLVTERLKLLEQINKNLTQTYSAIAGSDTTVKIEYESSIGLDGYSTKLLKKLESSQALDMQRGFTGNGPHRDDFTIYIKGQPALQSASRGEIRTLLLSLKIIELQILEDERSVRPLLLLDDVFSELDGARRRALTDFLKDYQTIITTTDADIVSRSFSQKCQIIPLS